MAGNLGEAIVRFFKKYAVFKGRASRSEFWWWFLTYTVVTFVLSLVFRTLRNLTDSGVIATVGDSFSSILGLVVLVPTIALGVRLCMTSTCVAPCWPSSTRYRRPPESSSPSV